MMLFSFGRSELCDRIMRKSGSDKTHILLNEDRLQRALKRELIGFKNYLLTSVRRWGGHLARQLSSGRRKGRVAEVLAFSGAGLVDDRNQR